MDLFGKERSRLTLVKVRERSKKGGRDSKLNLKIERFGPSTSARFQIRRSPDECTAVRKYIAGGAHIRVPSTATAVHS